MIPALRSAAYRIAWASSLLFAIATVAVGAIVYFATHAAFERQMEESIAQTSGALAGQAREEGIHEVIEAIGRREASGLNALGYAVFDDRGGRIAGGLDTLMPDIGWSEIVFIDPIEGPEPARAYTTVLSQGARLVVAADNEPLERIDATVLTIFGVAFAGLLLIGAAGALALGAYLRRRLLRIESTAAAIAGGDLTGRIPIADTGDEFDHVSASLNAMLDRIASLVANLRQVSSDLAHDLRTPLAKLRSQLEALQAAETDPEKVRAIEQAVERADDVLRLFAAILRIAEIEGDGLTQSFSQIDLSELVLDLAETHEPLVEDARKRLVVQAGERTCRVQGDRELIAQALINLIENALRHTPPSTLVEIGVRCRDRHAEVYVADDGPGIPADDWARVLQRFVRLESARSTPGHGLGLSLVSAIAASHKAELRLASRSPGLEAAIVFPPGAE